MLLMLGMLAGAVFVAALAVFLYIVVSNHTANRNAAIRRQLVRREQRIAEGRAQAVMQETVQRMFDAARERP